VETKRRDVITWCGLAVVGAAAAALSFTALDELAQLCGIRLHYLLPVTVDVFAATATRIWLRARAHPDAVAYARSAAWCAIVATIAGNALHGQLTSAHRLPSWWLVVAVAALPAVALGALVHLAVLVGRPVADAGQAELPPVDHEPPPFIRRPLVLPASDEVLIADLRVWAVDHGGIPPVDAIRLGYGVGTTRASRLRDIVTATPVNGTVVNR